MGFCFYSICFCQHEFAILYSFVWDLSLRQKLIIIFDILSTVCNNQQSTTQPSPFSTQSSNATNSVVNVESGQLDQKPNHMPILGQTFNIACNTHYRHGTSENSPGPEPKSTTSFSNVGHTLAPSSSTHCISIAPNGPNVAQNQSHQPHQPYQYQTHSALQNVIWPPPPQKVQHSNSNQPIHQSIFPTHYQDGRNGLRLRYLNILTRLFPQFSDIFINSVLEDANGELLAAAEWLVQLEDRRAFMYPALDAFGAIPLINPHYANAEYIHAKPSFVHQPPSSDNGQMQKVSIDRSSVDILMSVMFFILPLFYYL